MRVQKTQKVAKAKQNRRCDQGNQRRAMCPSDCSLPANLGQARGFHFTTGYGGQNHLA